MPQIKQAIDLSLFETSTSGKYREKHRIKWLLWGWAAWWLGDTGTIFSSVVPQLISMPHQHRHPATHQRLFYTPGRSPAKQFKKVFKEPPKKSEFTTILSSLGTYVYLMFSIYNIAYYILFLERGCGAPIFAVNGYYRLTKGSAMTWLLSSLSITVYNFGNNVQDTLMQSNAELVLTSFLF